MQDVVEVRFFDWLKRRGAEVSPVIGFAQFEGMGRGVVAKEDIEEGTTLFTIPRSIVLSTRTSSLRSRLDELHPEAWNSLGEGWAPLILAMMWESLRERGGEGDEGWWEYFDIMPDEFSTLMFWSDEELAELQGSTVLEKIGEAEATASYFLCILPLLRHFPEVFGQNAEERYTFNLFHIMGSRILSRSFQVEDSDAKRAEGEVDEEEEDGSDGESDSDEEEEEKDDVGNVAMVPLADILNAKSGCNNARLFYEKDVLRMVTVQSIKKGEQIFNTYAEPPNSDLLRRYGHVDEVNENDVAEVPADLLVDVALEMGSGADAPVGGEGEGADRDEEPRREDGDVMEVDDVPNEQDKRVTDKEQARRKALQERVEWWIDQDIDDSFVLSHPTFSTPPYPTLLPPELISALRILLLSYEDWQKARDKGKVPKPKLDEEVARFAVRVLERRLAQYPTSIEYDQALLSSSSLRLTTNHRNAVIVRLGEKQILAETKRIVEEEFTQEKVRERGNAERRKEKEKEKANGKRKAEEGERSSGKKRR